MTRRLFTAVALYLATATTTVIAGEAAPWFAAQVRVDMGLIEGKHHVGYGSGTPIHQEDGKTLILTNAHVVPDGSHPVTVTINGATYKARHVEGSVVTRDAGGRRISLDGPDLALVEVGAELGAVAIAAAMPDLGYSVYQWGYSGRGDAEAPSLVKREGIVYDSTAYKGELSSSLCVESGDSGAGVFNSSNELIAVTHGRAVFSDQVALSRSFAVELVVVRAFLARPRLAKLFPRIAARLAAKRAAKVLPPAVVSDAKRPAQPDVKVPPKPDANKVPPKKGDAKAPDPKPVPKKDVAGPTKPIYDPYLITTQAAADAAFARGVVGVIVGKGADPFAGTYRAHQYVPGGWGGLKDGAYLVELKANGFHCTPYAAGVASTAPNCADGRCAPGSAPTFTLPSAGGSTCPGGNCPAPSAPRRGFFR